MDLVDKFCGAPILRLLIFHSFCFRFRFQTLLRKELPEFTFRSGAVQVMLSLSFLTKAFNLHRMKFDNSLFS